MRKWGVEDLDFSLKCWLSGPASFTIRRRWWGIASARRSTITTRPSITSSSTSCGWRGRISLPPCGRNGSAGRGSVSAGISANIPKGSGRGSGRCFWRTAQRRSGAGPSARAAGPRRILVCRSLRPELAAAGGISRRAGRGRTRATETWSVRAAPRRRQARPQRMSRPGPKPDSQPRPEP